MRTLERNFENGKPLSLANDQICLDAVAISATTAKTIVAMMTADITFVAVRLPVVL